MYAENLEKMSMPAVLDSGFRAARRGYLDKGWTIKIHKSDD